MKKLLLVSTFLLMSLNSELHSAEPQTVEEYLALYGKWGSGMYYDEFGDKTNNGFINTIVRGTFDNIAGNGMPLRADLYISNGDVMKASPYFELYEYDRGNPIKGIYAMNTISCRMKDHNNIISDILLWQKQNKDYFQLNGESVEIFEELIMNEGSAKFACVDNRNKTSKYKFRFDFHGYNAKLKQYNDDLKST